ncbi:DUF2946 family protein [Pseudochelatococcus sp. B33]
MIGLLVTKRAGCGLSAKRRETRSWVAVVAAYALVIQSLLGAFAIGASAAPSRLDAFGTVICTSHGVEALPDGADPSKSGLMPDHCAVGCCAFAHAILSVPDYTAVPVAFVPQEDAVLRPAPEARASGREGLPGNPRAPPVSV